MISLVCDRPAHDGHALKLRTANAANNALRLNGKEIEVITRIGSFIVTLATLVVCASCAATRELSNMDPISFTSGIISGSVTDSLTQQPVVGAEVTLLTAEKDTAGDQHAKTFSFSPRGEYRFDNVRPGSYVLRVTAAGYDTTVRAVRKIDAGERYTVVFRLRRAE